MSLRKVIKHTLNQSPAWNIERGHTHAASRLLGSIDVDLDVLALALKFPVGVVDENEDTWAADGWDRWRGGDSLQGEKGGW